MHRPRVELEISRSLHHRVTRDRHTDHCCTVNCTPLRSKMYRAYICKLFPQDGSPQARCQDLASDRSGLRETKLLHGHPGPKSRYKSGTPGKSLWHKITRQLKLLMQCKYNSVQTCVRFQMLSYITYFQNSLYTGSQNSTPFFGVMALDVTLSNVGCITNKMLLRIMKLLLFSES